MDCSSPNLQRFFETISNFLKVIAKFPDLIEGWRL